MLGASHTGVDQMSRRVEKDVKALSEALRQSGSCALYVKNKEEIEEKFQKLFEDVYTIAFAFEIDIKIGETSDDTRRSTRTRERTS